LHDAEGYDMSKMINNRPNYLTQVFTVELLWHARLKCVSHMPLDTNVHQKTVYGECQFSIMPFVSAPCFSKP
jgi:hypothetical protein